MINSGHLDLLTKLFIVETLTIAIKGILKVFSINTALYLIKSLIRNCFALRTGKKTDYNVMTATKAHEFLYFH